VSEPWSEGSARKAAERAAARLGLTEPIELVRLGTNGVFFSGETVVRVSPPDESPELVQQQLEFARWLVDNEFPTSAPFLDEPVVVGCTLVTTWSRIRGEPGREADRVEFGQLLRHFHALTDSYQGPMPEWEPLGRLGQRLDEVPSDDTFSEDDRKTLCRWRDDLVSAARELEWVLDPGPLHGDVHTGNLIVNESGQYLVDLDRIARGPREWDLTQPVGSLQRFGGDPAQVDEFMAGYGWDLRSWSGSEILVSLRLLFMTSWLLTVPRNDRVRAEISTRMSYWRQPSDAAGRWNPV
jgi:Ser/Thr protein kinase RdoA (MazF antagonist)